MREVKDPDAQAARPLDIATSQLAPIRGPVAVLVRSTPDHDLNSDASPSNILKAYAVMDTADVLPLCLRVLNDYAFLPINIELSAHREHHHFSPSLAEP